VGAIVERRDPGFTNPFETFKTHWYTGAANLLRSMPAEKRHDLDPGLLAIADEGERIATGITSPPPTRVARSVST